MLCVLKKYNYDNTIEIGKEIAQIERGTSERSFFSRRRRRYRCCCCRIVVVVLLSSSSSCCRCRRLRRNSSSSGCINDNIGDLLFRLPLFCSAVSIGIKKYEFARASHAQSSGTGRVDNTLVARTSIPSRCLLVAEWCRGPPPPARRCCWLAAGQSTAQTG